MSSPAVALVYRAGDGDEGMDAFAVSQGDGAGQSAVSVFVVKVFERARTGTPHAGTCKTRDPTYPPSARKSGEVGTATLHYFVSNKGVPTSFELARSSGFESLDRAAVEFIAGGTFKPPTMKGVAHGAWPHQKFTFALKP